MYLRPIKNFKIPFDGDTVIHGKRIAYKTWPLLENPWMQQKWNFNLTLKDGPTRVYDVDQWCIDENTGR